jgi:hypothetical protein
MGNLGDLRASRRWWRSARYAADASTDPQVRVWVRGREVIRALYENQPLHHALALADEAAAITPTPGMGTGSVLIGRAQALAMLGRTRETREAMTRVYQTVDRLPAAITSDTQSMYGWSEYRLRHGESFVYTYLADSARAEAAQDRALTLYPPSMFRGRAQVQLHQAMRLVRTGDLNTGIGHARQAVHDLSDTQRIQAILEVARSVVRAVPDTEQHRPDVAELRELSALPSHPSTGTPPA